MADAIPTPGEVKTPPSTSTVVVEKSITHWQALVEAGWWNKSDTLFMTVILLTWMTTLFWLLFHTPGPESVSRWTVIVTVLLASLSLKALWLISLIFRCSWFVLRLNADVAMLPNASARIAVAYLSGKK